MKVKVAAIVCALALAPFAGEAAEPPTADEKAFARQVADTLQERIFALLMNEFANTTADNFEAGNVAISLVFADDNPSFRLVGTLEPLRGNDTPQDAFEAEALPQAMAGKAVEGVYEVDGEHYFRRSIPLTNFDPSCAICHGNYASPPDDAPVGALMLRVPVIRDTAQP